MLLPLPRTVLHAQAIHLDLEGHEISVGEDLSGEEVDENEFSNVATKVKKK